MPFPSPTGAFETILSYYAIEKWGQRIYVKCHNFRYSPFFGERILYKIRCALK